jgi:leucyl aminopeptidase
MKRSLVPSSAGAAVRALLRPNVDALRAAGIEDSALNAYQNRVDRGVKGWMHLATATGDLMLATSDADAATPEGLHALRQLGADLGGILAKNKLRNVVLDAQPAALTVAEGLALNAYRFTKLFGIKAKDQWSLDQLDVVGADTAEFAQWKSLIEGVAEARDLINTPVLQLGSLELAARTEELALEHGFKCTVLHKAQIEALKMGGLLGVNKGSIDPPVFIVLEYFGQGATNEQPYALVGKGVVYDTGGISLKPSNFMEDMKCDMSGAAAVIGTFCAVAAAKLPVNVVGLIPATDNRLNNNALVPGDVITISNGVTVEVLNTDAEGRLILADALHYAKKYNPKLVIDLATLTGAASRAIGPYATVAMGTADRATWNALQASAGMTHERLVEFPFWDDYKDLIKSEIADIKNIGGAEAGMITAGKFLEYFIDYPYVHLDIAGPAFLDRPVTYYGKGGTGVGVRLLTHFLTAQSKA